MVPSFIAKIRKPFLPQTYGHRPTNQPDTLVRSVLNVAVCFPAHFPHMLAFGLLRSTDTGTAKYVTKFLLCHFGVIVKHTLLQRDIDGHGTQDVHCRRQRFPGFLPIFPWTKNFFAITFSCNIYFIHFYLSHFCYYSITPHYSWKIYFPYYNS